MHWFALPDQIQLLNSFPKIRNDSGGDGGGGAGALSDLATPLSATKWEILSDMYPNPAGNNNHAKNWSQLHISPAIMISKYVG